MESFKDVGLLAMLAPVYIVLIGVEVVLSALFGRHYYSFRGTLTNIGLAAMNVGLDVALRATWFAFLSWIFSYHVLQVEQPWAYWVTLLVLQDLLFYWLHRVDHTCRLFWAVHLTHHSSEEFNLTVGFRPSVLQPLYRFAWFSPLVILGYRPEDVLLMYSLTQTYGILVHTRFVGRLGWLEWILATPSNHRVHHGCNTKYRDRNMGMVLIVWDRLFGSFQAETEEVRFGLTGGPTPRHPVGIVLHEWRAIWADVRMAIPWRAKLMYVFGPPGWRHEPDADGRCLTR